MKQFLILLTTAVFAICGSVMASALTPTSEMDSRADQGSVSDRFAQANDLFSLANAKALKNPAKAQSYYRAAILKYQFLADQDGVSSPELFANLGNAYFFAGDMGHAVLSYQKSLDLDPLQEGVWHNLHYTRTITIDELPQSNSQKVVDALTFWHRWPFPARAVIFGLAHSAIWLMVALLFYRRFRGHFAVTAVVGVIALIFGLSLLVSLQAWDNPVDGVVIDREVVARQGDGYIYDTAFASSLHAGTEFSLIERRGDWCHAQLLDGSTCWLPSKAVGMVR